VDTQAGIHIDEANSGLAAVWADGDFRGGRLIVIPPNFQPQIVCVRQRWAFLQPFTAHAVEKWTGDRISVVAYWRDPQTIPAHEERFLRSLGFQLEISGTHSFTALPGACADKAAALQHVSSCRHTPVHVWAQAADHALTKSNALSCPLEAPAPVLTSEPRCNRAKSGPPCTSRFLLPFVCRGPGLGRIATDVRVSLVLISLFVGPEERSVPDRCVVARSLNNLLRRAANALEHERLCPGEGRTQPLGTVLLILPNEAKLQVPFWGGDSIGDVLTRYFPPAARLLDWLFLLLTMTEQLHVAEFH
jgi:hypothetical protein